MAELQKEKEDLLKRVESSSEITCLTEEVAQVTVPRIQITSLGPSRSMDLEMKQLQCKLKVIINFIKDENMCYLKICLKISLENILRISLKNP